MADDSYKDDILNLTVNDWLSLWGDDSIFSQEAREIMVLSLLHQSSFKNNSTTGTS